MFDVSFELTKEYSNSADCKQVLEYARATDKVIDSATLSERKDVPFTLESFQRFCNSMITLHRDTMVREPSGITVTGDGVKVSTIRGQKGMTYKVQRDLSL